MAPRVAAHPWPPLPAGPVVLLVGAASPDGILDALWAGRTLVLWERSAPILRAFLEADDWEAPLRSGQLTLRCDVDLLTLDLPPGTPVVLHPLLGPRYARELAWMARPPSAPPRRALIVEGGLLVEEVGRALVEDGYQVWTWETARLPRSELERIARALGPSLVVAINHTPGLPEAVERLAEHLPDLQLRIWEVDPALDPIRPPTAPVPRTIIRTWRRPHVDLLREAGFQAAWLPLASDPEWRRPISLSPSEHAEFAAPVVFVGNSMVAEAQAFRQRLLDHCVAAGRRVEDAERRLAKVIAEQATLLDRYVLPDLLREALPELWEGTLAGQGADPGMLAGEIVAAEHRLNVVANLGRFGVHVWGDSGWSGLVHHGVRWRGAAGHGHQLPRIYSNGGIHVDIGRRYQADIVTLRVFDVAACGGFLLAEANADLEALFVPGQEIETWRTIPELRAKVQRYLEHPEEAARIAERGRQRVLRDHTVRQRVARLLGGTDDWEA